jgi:hypothetical protein
MKHVRTILAKLHPFKNRRGAVRFMFPAAAVSVAAALGAAAITADDTSYVRLESTHTTVEAGERFSIDIYAYAHEPVNAVNVTLIFDPESVTVAEIDRGQSVITIWTEDPVIEDDRVVLRGGTFRRGFIGEHKVARLDLVAKETGQKTFSATEVVLLAGDGAGSPVETSAVAGNDANVFIYDENTDPEQIEVAVSMDLRTDLNSDGEVTLQDISVFMSAWNARDTRYDFNGDGRMSFRDFSILLADYFFQ